MTTPAAEYTPTTDEVEENYIYGRYDGHQMTLSAEDAGAEFDRFIATTIRQAKAEALREAAAAVNGEIDDSPLLAEGMREFWTETLIARASRIEAGE